MQGHITKRTTDTLSSAFGLACEYSRNTLLPSARLGTFCGREVCDSARLGRKRFRSRKSKVEVRAKKMEVGGGGKEKVSYISPPPPPPLIFFHSIYLIIFLSSSSFRALTRLGSKKSTLMTWINVYTINLAGSHGVPEDNLFEFMFVRPGLLS